MYKSGPYFVHPSRDSRVLDTVNYNRFPQLLLIGQSKTLPPMKFSQLNIRFTSPLAYL